MWDPFAPEKKPFYLRPWFLVAAGLCLLGVVGAWVGWLVLTSEYRSKAAEFDFKQLEEMESASLIYDRNNNVMGRIFFENRDKIPIEEMPDNLLRAVVAAEDARFYEHKGVDYYGMCRAAIRNWQAGRIREGASTLTQQLARNSFDLREKTYRRKILEIFLAQEIERRYPKRKILELYLNRVYFGVGFYGVEAAAFGYFGKTARELSLSECATLTGLLKNPNKLSPWSNRQACLESRDIVLGRMLNLGMISRSVYLAAVDEHLQVKNRKRLYSQSYPIDMVRQQVVGLVGHRKAISNGYRIYTTIDSDLQKTAEESLRRHLRDTEAHPEFAHQRFDAIDQLYKKSLRTNPENPPTPEYLQGALVVLDNATGAILSLVGGRDFNHSQFNRVTQAARPAGTAFLPLLYAAAYENGIFPGTLLDDAIIDNRQVMIGGMTGILGEWGVESADNAYEGLIPAREALVKSKNAASVRLGMKVGLDRVIELSKLAGITSELRQFPATFLGSSEVTLLEMTLAFTMFSQAGVRPEKPFIVSRIETKEGDVIFKETQTSQKVISETSAYEVHAALREALEWGTGATAFAKYGLRKLPIAGKTGTAYNFTDTCFIGYTSEITCGVWAGFDKPTPIYRGAFSKELVLPIWVDVMNASFANYKPAEVSQPQGLKNFEICRTSGQLATEQCFELSDNQTKRRTTYVEMGTQEQAPRITCRIHGYATAGQPVEEEKKPASEWPRAAIAVDLSQIAPVLIQGPTIVGEEDPYESLKPTGVRPAVRVDTGELPKEEVKPSPTPAEKLSQSTEVRRAEPARPIDQMPTDANVIPLEPPPPIEF